MRKLLVVEDDPALSKGLEMFLVEEGFEVHCLSDGRKGFLRAASERFDLIILDLGLPGKSGEDICSELRAQEIHTPILMLTSKNRVEERVHGLAIGADDYLTKPFDLTELNARIIALLRRPSQLDLQLKNYRFGDVSIDFETCRINRGKLTFTGSLKEFEVLRYLVINENKIVSRDDILNTIWGMEAFPTPRTVDNFILSIRKKIEREPRSPKHLLSLYGTGYQFISKPGSGS
jgi:DNA-binding response OmpR family regulator